MNPNHRSTVFRPALEFALTVTLAGVLVSMMLSRVEDLKASASDAQSQLSEAQLRSTATLEQFRAGSREGDAASPCTTSPTSAPNAQTLPGSPSRPCL
jgi:hypothetical protein